ncbi:MAG: metallophosphoesterase family protein [Candidatus Njordarchaeales archaeon]
MRIIHTADLHLGVSSFPGIDPHTGLKARWIDHINAFRQVVDFAVQNDVDFFIMAGDIFHRTNPTPDLYKLLGAELKRLVDARIHVIMIPGNHDRPKTLKRATPLDTFSVFDLDYIHMSKNPATLNLTGKSGEKATFILFPFVHQIFFVEKLKEKLSPEELEELNEEQEREAYADSINKTIKRMLLKKHEDSKFTFLVAHLTVSGAKFGAERRFIYYHEWSILPYQLAEPGIDYIALGHIHKHQEVASPNGIPIVYSGSLERVDFSESKEDKGFILIETHEKDLSWEFIKVRTRPMTELLYDVKDLGQDLERINNDLRKRNLRNALVKIILRGESSIINKIDTRNFEKFLEGVFYCRFGRIFTDQNDSSAKFGSQEFSQDLTPDKALKKYLEKEKMPKELREKLLKLGLEIIQEVIGGIL